MKNHPIGVIRLIASIVAILGLFIGIGPRVLNAQVSLDELEGQALVESLREGGLVVFFRHADTVGMPCDSLYRIGQREGQRNLSTEGEQQSQRIGETLSVLNIPIQKTGSGRACFSCSRHCRTSFWRGPCRNHRKPISR